MASKFSNRAGEALELLHFWSPPHIGVTCIECREAKVEKKTVSIQGNVVDRVSL